MKTLTTHALALVAALSIVPTQGHAAWQTVDSPDRTEYQDIATDAVGNVFAVGDYIPVSGPGVAILRRSLDGGETWQTVAMPPTAPASFSQFVKVTVDLAGQVYVLRYVGSNFELWRSPPSDAGSNLTLVTTFDSSYGEIAKSLASDAGGNVYVCGSAFDGIARPWRTLKGVPVAGTLNWTVVDDYAGALFPVRRLAVRPATNPALPAEIWVGGTGSNSIVFRRSTDAGATWTSVGDCHRAVQNRPLVGTSKPASLRQEFHNKFLD